MFTGTETPLFHPKGGCGGCWRCLHKAVCSFHPVDLQMWRGFVFQRLVCAVRWVRMGADPSLSQFSASCLWFFLWPPPCAWHLPSLCLGAAVSSGERITRSAVCEQHTRNNHCAPAVLLPGRWDDKYTCKCRKCQR